MKRSPLGRSGLSTAPIAFGGNVFGWTVTSAESFTLLDRFVERGFNLIDTADTYSAGETGRSERIIGAWLKESAKRDDVLIATKVGMEMAPGKKGLSPAYIAAACDDSIQRLGTDRIDLYQAHVDDPDVPIADVLGAFARLIDAGKVRAIGASNFTAARLAEALNVSESQSLPRYETSQPQYNLLKRDAYEGAMQQLCVARGVGVIPFFGLASGMLTGKYRSIDDFAGKARAPILNNYATSRAFAIIDTLVTIAERRGAKPAQVALAWAMAQPGVAAPIASATDLGQLDEILASVDLDLDPSDFAALDMVSRTEADLGQ
jgi:aryl-alcohol dehydrogenase-like predicted oxidoreductase